MLLLFVFFVATVNLAVGYALGSGMSFPLTLPALPLIGGSKRPPADLDEGDVLTKPVAERAEPAPVVEPESKPQLADILAGLSSFREKLSEASADVKESLEDPEKFDENTGRLQKVNHDYLEQAQDAADRLTDMSAAGDAEATSVCEAVSNGAKEVAEISSQIDELMEGDLDEASRAKLVERSEAICQAAELVEGPPAEAAPTPEAIPESTEPPPEPEPEAEADTTPTPKTEPAESPSAEATPAIPVNTVASYDALFDKLEALLETAIDTNPLHLAAVRLDPIEGHENDTVLTDAISVALAGLSAQALTPDQPMLGGDPTFALLSGDSFDEAAERVERLRQQVASCNFSREGKSVAATVTCAITEAATGADREQLREQLLVALDEAGEHGTNRTFHHDGAFPTPIPEKPANVTAITIAI